MLYEPNTPNSDDAGQRQITANSVRYIKLGKAGEHENECLEQNILWLGFHAIPHDAALEGDLAAMKAAALKYRGSDKAQVATSDVNQTRAFYEATEDDLWITFIHGRLYWCFAEAEVEWIEDEVPEKCHRIRRCKSPWSDQNIFGQPLLMSELNGALTRVSAYRGSVCQVSKDDYVLDKINGIDAPAVVDAKRLKVLVTENIRTLIQSLTWADFELLVDLIFGASGWRRQGATGGTQKTVDLELILPSTGEQAFVQVKSQTHQGELDAYLTEAKARPESRMFFVYHSVSGQLSTSEPSCSLIGPDRLAIMVLDAGLYDWLIRKAN